MSSGITVRHSGQHGPRAASRIHSNARNGETIWFAGVMHLPVHRLFSFAFFLR